MRVCLSRIYAKDRGLSGVKAGSCSAARAAKSNELSGICISPILEGTAKVFHNSGKYTGICSGVCLGKCSNKKLMDYILSKYV